MAICSVSSLVLLAGWEGDKPEFGTILLGQVKTLRDQLDKDKDSVKGSETHSAANFPRVAQGTSGGQTNGSRLARFDARHIGQPRIWDTSASSPAGRMPGALPGGTEGQGGNNRRDVRTIASAAAALGRSFIS
ncbi:hypothetical protein BC628DRAFT_1419831 [Trametes gibbosa]|nr:hypothetical protein BC628DRAFT_1419831 [Trametes gibbosa]